MVFPLKWSKFSQNESRGRENLFTQTNLRPQKISSLFQSEKPSKPIFTQKLK